jgi:hypothetical protein
LIQITGQIPWKVACEKTESGIMTSFDFKDRKGVLFSLFAVGAVGSEVANRNDFNRVIFLQQRQTYFGTVHKLCNAKKGG